MEDFLISDSGSILEFANSGKDFFKEIISFLNLNFNDLLTAILTIASLVLLWISIYISKQANEISNQALKENRKSGEELQDNILEHIKITEKHSENTKKLAYEIKAQRTEMLHSRLMTYADIVVNRIKAKFGEKDEPFFEYTFYANNSNPTPVYAYILNDKNQTLGEKIVFDKKFTLVSGVKFPERQEKGVTATKLIMEGGGFKDQFEAMNDKIKLYVHFSNGDRLIYFYAHDYEHAHEEKLTNIATEEGFVIERYTAIYRRLAPEDLILF